MTRREDEAVRLQNLAGLDKLIHEPGRLAIMSMLFVVEEADFLYLLDQTRLTRGNLSSHMAKLETAGHVEVTKEFVDRVPRTTYRLTEQGRRAFVEYRRNLLDSLGGGQKNS
jgi:DNA-binding MarR family transcriptional regulator